MQQVLAATTEEQKHELTSLLRLMSELGLTIKTEAHTTPAGPEVSLVSSFNKVWFVCLTQRTCFTSSLSCSRVSRSPHSTRQPTTTWSSGRFSCPTRFCSRRSKKSPSKRYLWSRK